MASIKLGIRRAITRAIFDAERRDGAKETLDDRARQLIGAAVLEALRMRLLRCADISSSITSFYSSTVGLVGIRAPVAPVRCWCAQTLEEEVRISCGPAAYHMRRRAQPTTSLSTKGSYADSRRRND